MDAAAMRDAESDCARGPKHHCSALDRQIARYAKPLQSRIREFALGSPRHADLAYSFPAACVALALHRGSEAGRKKAWALLRAGAALAGIANALDLPMWFRKLPPEAIQDALPDRFGAELEETRFGRAIANAVPIAFEPENAWLRTIAQARAQGGDDFALWLAHEIRDARRDLPPTAVALLAAFAFFSQRRRPGHALRARAWTPRCALASTAFEMQRWLVPLLLDCQAAGRRSRGLPLIYYANGFDFVSLDTYDALMEEGRTMRHCILSYAESVVLGQSRIFGMRSGEERIATIEVAPPRAAEEVFIIEQMCGPSNVRPTQAHAAAAQAWLADAACMREFAIAHGSTARLSSAAWRSYWSPFWSERGVRPPIAPAPYGCAASLIEASRALLSSLKPEHEPWR